MSDAYTLPSINPGLDTVWVGINTMLIFFMQLGFTMVEAGTVRFKNIHSILMKNTLDVCVGTFSWWLVGYSFAFGESQGGFIGSSSELFLGRKFGEHNVYLHFMNQWAFASTSCTIISGAVAERLTMKGYMVICTFMTLFIYPVPVHWVWGIGGWLGENGFHDFAGVNAVHMVGGTAGLIATAVIKPRTNRFDPKEMNKFKPNSVPFVVLGTLLLWFCWYGFNCGTVVNVEENYKLIGLVAINTTLGAVSGALSCFGLTYLLDSKCPYDMGTLNICMGILSGLVAVTGCCDVIEPWASVIIGLISGFVFIGFQKLLYKFKIDDPLDASTIHLGVGIWGGIATGIFQHEEGLIYGGGSIGIQLLGMVAISAWTLVLVLIIVKILEKRNLLRPSLEVEERGFDNIYVDDDGEEDNLQNILMSVDILKKSIKALKSQ